MSKPIKKPYVVKGVNKVRAYEPILPLYNIPYLIYVGKTVSDAGDAAILELGPNVKPNISVNTAAKAIHIVHEEYGDAYIILLGIDSCSKLLITAAHEALHISWWIGDTIGLEYDAENHEAQTYIMQSIFGEAKAALEDYIKFYKLKTKL